MGGGSIFRVLSVTTESYAVLNKTVKISKTKVSYPRVFLIFLVLPSLRFHFDKGSCPGKRNRRMEMNLEKNLEIIVVYHFRKF